MKKGKIAMGIIIFIIAVLLLIGVPICINLCFKPRNRWTAGNVLTYYGTTLSFLGTVTFSTLSIYHTKQINFIREKSTQMWVETRKAGKLTRKAETDTIQKLVEYAKGQGSSHAEMLYMTYSRLVNKMAGINKRDEATVMQLNNLSLMENIILHEVDLGIMQGKHYQEIYRDCKKRLEAVKDLAYLEAV